MNFWIQIHPCASKRHHYANPNGRPKKTIRRRQQCCYTNELSVFPLLHESLQQVLSFRLGWDELRDVQERTYNAIIGGSDVLVIAPTAGGKSEAALIPVMDDILKYGRSGVACLYISPLKALINDQEERFSAFCVPTGLSVMKWHGDVPKGDRGWIEGEPPHFVMITPESLEVLLQEKNISADLKNLRSVIIDELHAFVESERGVHLKCLLSRLDVIAKKPVQRIGLSATLGNPEEILCWLSDNRKKTELVMIPAPVKEKQFVFIVEEEEKKRIDALVRIVSGRKALVFVNSRGEAEKCMKAGEGRIRNLHIHHSSLATVTRKTAEDAFHSDSGACIICTSTLELGIDIGDLDVVVQVGPPNSVSAFLQRMGRSGRRGKSAFVAWIVKNPCELVCCCAVVECAMNKEVEDLLPPKKPYNVLIQQIFLTLLHAPRIARKKLTRQLLSLPAFSDISSGVLDEIVKHLIAEGYLTLDGEVLMFGTTAEQVFGRSNWKAIYSVISGGGEYRAVTPDGEVVGKLDARFVNSPQAADLSLGGKSWSVVKCDEGRTMVVVVPHESDTSRVFWSGGEGGMSPLVCAAVQRIIGLGRTTLPLGTAEQDILNGVFSRIPPELEEHGIFVFKHNSIRGREVLIYSFHGSRFNRVLTLLLQERLGSHVMVRYNDFFVKVQRAGKEFSAERVATAIRDLQLWTQEEIGEFLPQISPDTGKFTEALPMACLQEMAILDYYHVEEFLQILRNEPITVLADPEPKDPATE
jgi:ATP-dependent helicase Lhr and Lhr-like helicase